MTAGIVSATNRTITAPNNFSITGAIQTDAAINHGNSGGPLIDAATNTVIGINDQILNAGDTNDNAGVGFAVPIDASKAVAADAHRRRHGAARLRRRPDPDRRPAAPRSRRSSPAPRRRRPG